MKNTRFAHRALAAAMALGLLMAGCSEAAAPEASPEATAAPTQTAEAPQEAALFTPGSYTASVYGNNDYLNVTVTVDEDSILSVEVPGHSETRFLGDAAIEKITKDIVEYQTLNVDSVSGATVTSGALKSAALLRAHGVMLGRIHVVDRRPTRVDALVERRGFAALAPAQLVQACVHGDAVHPGGKGGLAFKTGNGTVDAQHRFLEAILRVFPMPAHAQGDRVHAPLLRGHQLGKRLSISTCGPLDQGLFVHLHAVTSFCTSLIIHENRIFA